MKNNTISVKDYITKSEHLNNILNEADSVLKSVINGRYTSFGLVSADVKNETAYIDACKNFNKAFKNLRDFNSTIPNKVALEARIIRRGF